MGRYLGLGLLASRTVRNDSRSFFDTVLWQPELTNIAIFLK
jgi:hypothetical protein